MKKLWFIAIVLMAQNVLAAAPIKNEPKAEPPCPFRKETSLLANTNPPQERKVTKAVSRRGQDGAALKKQ